MKIAPSVLAADFSNLECELKDIETGGADLVHLDVMDGTCLLYTSDAADD